MEPRAGRIGIRGVAAAAVVAFLVSLVPARSFGAPGPLPGRDVDFDYEKVISSVKFGPLGKYITTAELAEPWMSAAGGAYRGDVYLMSSSDPIVYKTTFKAPGNPDLAGMRAAGIKLVLTVRNSTKKKDIPLPADGSKDAAFQAAIGSMIDQLQPDVIVYGNEVNSENKYSGTVDEFAHLMELGHAVASSRGVVDGGTALMGTVTSQATYADLLASEGVEEAEAFAKAADMAPFDQALADEANAYIDACRSAGVDYFVWHSYFADPSAILDIKDYVERRFGGPSVINELGWRTGKAQTGKDIIDALSAAGPPFVLLYGSGEGTNAPDKLWDSDGVPTSEGRTISDHLQGE